MRKKSSMKFMAAGLAAAMALSAAGCGGSGQTAQTTAAGTTAAGTTAGGTSAAETTAAGSEAQTEEASGGVTFPLAEPMTFDIMIPSDKDAQEAASKIPLLADLEEKTNVKINWIPLPKDTAMNNLNSLFAAGQEGDAIMGMNAIIGEGGTSSMGSSGLLIPLEEYVDNPAIMPNLNGRVFAEEPRVRNSITTPDGHVYALPKYQAFAGNYLETPIWINKEWLAAVDEEVPTTLDDLHRVLTKFKENDVNGNGDPNDEIPLMVCQNGNINYVEGLLQPWGLATKDLANDRYIDIKDGKCYYVATDEAYREAIRTLASWYKEGLIWSEVYTANFDTWAALFTKEEVPVVGVAFSKGYPASVTYKDQYEAIPAISADGYEAKWWYHPGGLGAKGMFMITRSCEHPEILAAWIDQFYALDVSVQAASGVQGGLWDYDESGKIFMRTANYQDETDLGYLETAMGDGLGIENLPGAFTPSDYVERLQLSDTQVSQQANYELYKPVIGTEIWPRPYMTDDITARINELYTDIDSTTDMYRANWLTGVSDIDAEWDSYLETLNKIGLEEFVELHQQAYDVFQGGAEQ